MLMSELVFRERVQLWMLVSLTYSLFHVVCVLLLQGVDLARQASCTNRHDPHPHYRHN